MPPEVFHGSQVIIGIEPWFRTLFKKLTFKLLSVEPQLKKLFMIETFLLVFDSNCLTSDKSEAPPAKTPVYIPVVVSAWLWIKNKAPITANTTAKDMAIDL